MPTDPAADPDSLAAALGPDVGHETREVNIGGEQVTVYRFTRLDVYVLDYRPTYFMRVIGSGFTWPDAFKDARRGL